MAKIRDISHDFSRLWRSHDAFVRHVATRLEKGHIKDTDDYILKTLDCLAKSRRYTLAIHKNSWDNVCYNTEEWAVVFNENGEMMTSYPIDPLLKAFEQRHLEVGAKIETGETDETIREAFRRLRDRYQGMGK